jgi:hypothetical protein
MSRDLGLWKQVRQQAGTALACASQIVRLRVPSLDAGDLGLNWPDVVMTHVWLKEARNLVEGATGTGDAMK